MSSTSKFIEDLKNAKLSGQCPHCENEFDLAKTILLKVLAGEHEPDSGTIKWGQTAQTAYMPSDNNIFFNNNKLLIVIF